MTIYIGADHGGFELKKQLIEYLLSKNIFVEDMGNTVLDPLDDFPDFAKRVALKVQVVNKGTYLGIVICRSGDGVAMTANRFKGIRCSVGFSLDQVANSKRDDNTNILALPSDFIDFETACQFVDTFLNTAPKTEEKYVRRQKKIDEN